MDPREAFEIYAPASVEALSPYLNTDPSITHARIVCTPGASLAAAVILTSTERKWQPLAGTAEFMEFFMSLVQAHYESWDQVEEHHQPTLLITDYDVVNESLEADFRYDELQPGIPVEKREPEPVWLDGWIERYFTTGDESTSLVLPNDFDFNPVAERNAQGYPLH